MGQECAVNNIRAATLPPSAAISQLLKPLRSRDSGVRFRNALMHDGTSPTLRDAVLRHSGEAGDVNRRFQRPKFSIEESVIERGTPDLRVKGEAVYWLRYQTPSQLVVKRGPTEPKTPGCGDLPHSRFRCWLAGRWV